MAILKCFTLDDGVQSVLMVGEMRTHTLLVVTLDTPIQRFVAFVTSDKNVFFVLTPVREVPRQPKRDNFDSDRLPFNPNAVLPL